MAACFVSLCDFTSPKTLIKDIDAQKTDSCRLHLSSSTFVNGICFTPPNSREQELLSLKLHRNPVAAVILDYRVFCTPRVISGFWIGPDVEDGSGFVEAIVYQMFDA
ncbi:hypothetical protein HanXRQr2_Chr05g0236491 [Helianthus annuus]|uniref:Uncharacterized protein n=1 Tax=Helianthus annuus TaxID=4232 RepID=A0A251UTT3_HELAN|nr:uncharacterized protein LOC110942348 isoform X2 [Helianthus annuus]KAF5807691.1 hypothetical protein HanXRQr2_Chr05g0236491 [Helianthus annuus]